MIRMIGSKTKPTIPFICMAMLFMAFATFHAPAQAKPQPPVETTESAMPESMEFGDGTITQGPRLDPVTKKMTISIDKNEYFLSPATAVSETGIDGMSAFYEKNVNMTALRQGQKVSFDFFGNPEKTIVRIVIDTMIHGR